MNKILVPIDGSDCSGVAIEKAKELAGFYNARLVILHVYDMPIMRAYFDFDHKEREASVMQDLRNRSERVLAMGAEVLADLPTDRYELVSLEGDPGDCIVEYVCDPDNGIDMVVMGSHGMGGVRRIVLGSVAHKVVVQVEKPVLII